MLEFWSSRRRSVVLFYPGLSHADPVRPCHPFKGSGPERAPALLGASPDVGGLPLPFPTYLCHSGTWLGHGAVYR